MINFAKYALNKEKEVISPIPVAHITHGSHANRPIIPDLYIEHGRHSRDSVNEERHMEDFLSDTTDNNHISPVRKHVADHLEDSQYETTMKLPQKEKSALQSYSNQSRRLNQDLIENKNTPEKLDPWHKEWSGNLDNAIKKHNLPKLTVFSGIGFDPGEQTKDSNGVMKSSAYVSSSLSKRTAYSFARMKHGDDGNYHSHMLRIHVPDGHKGVYMGGPDSLRQLTNANESEVLLPRGMHFKITGKNTHVKDKDHLHVWEAHIIPEGENPHTWEPK